MEHIKNRDNDFPLKVALYGGAFNPIHYGHVAVARILLHRKLVDEVWLCPCFQHTFHKTLAATEQRIHMCQLALQDEPKIRVFNYEIVHQLDGGTYQFIDHLLHNREANDYNFSYVIGINNANIFHTWKKYQELEQLIPFIVVPRKGFQPLKKAWYLRAPHKLLSDDASIPDVSSTMIRERVAKHEPIEKWVHFSVATYIHEQSLYL